MQISYKLLSFGPFLLHAPARIGLNIISECIRCSAYFLSVDSYFPCFLQVFFLYQASGISPTLQKTCHWPNEILRVGGINLMMGGGFLRSMGSLEGWSYLRRFHPRPVEHTRGNPKIQIWKDFRIINRYLMVWGMFLSGSVGVFLDTWRMRGPLRISS